MRGLILMRHAEAAAAAAAAAGGADFARPLTSRGRDDAIAAARRLLQAHGAPDHLLCSPAQRTTETATVLRTTLRLDGLPLITDPRIYLASPELLRQVISECPDTAQRVLLIAHNPAISQLVAALQGGRGRALATAEFCPFSFAIDNWQQLPEVA